MVGRRVWRLRLLRLATEGRVIKGDVLLVFLLEFELALEFLPHSSIPTAGTTVEPLDTAAWLLTLKRRAAISWLRRVGSRAG